MLSGDWLKGHDQKRLRVLLLGLFIALTVPTAVLIQQAFAQLKWESYYQYRVQAEDVTGRIDSMLTRNIALAESRSFADYQFVVAATGNVIQRSPLSAYPAAQDVPGAIGYFQVSADGSFSSPLLPDPSLPDTGISAAELAARQRLAANIETVLAENELVRSGTVAGRRLQTPAPASEMPAISEPSGPKESATEELQSGEAVAAQVASEPADFVVQSGKAVASTDDRDSTGDRSVLRYDQQVFDQLNRRSVESSGDNTGADAPQPNDERRTNNAASPQRIGKVQDLNLDDSLQKLEQARKREEPTIASDAAESADAGRARSIEMKSELSPAAIALEAELDSVDNENTPAIITAFESETDPFEFSMLDSGHFVLFRKVWRGGERFIQGVLIDQATFLNATIESAYRSSALSGMSDLVIAYDDDILRMFPGLENSSYTDMAKQLDGSLLYRSRLGAPLGQLELVYSINRLPPGPGAVVLGWTTLVIGLVFTGGFFALYRLGLGQIRLARQQQDFVSAVSHELKTPLTSIRMYGEMLKEGWVDDEKRKQYYEYIHDESERLTRLISNVLQLANISRNQPGIAMKRTQVSELMDQVRSKIASQAERAGFDIEFEDDAKTLETRIDIDTDCFLQIVINLVDNAIKFSRNSAEKTIQIGTRTTSDGMLEFRVRDFGPGIPKNQIRKIFRLFYRSESELTRETVGTGIGLAIVHQLATAMNGIVDVQNMQPGAEFRLRFPVQAS